MKNSAEIQLIGYVYGEPKHPMPEKYPNWIKFTLSVTKKWKDKNGQEQKDISWFECQTSSEGMAKVIKNYVKQGMGLLVKGIPKSRAFIDKEGQPQGNIEVNISELNMLTYPTEKEGPAKPKSEIPKTTAVISPKQVEEFYDDQIPF
jgi:single stranded DNA-binding protein